MARMSWRRLILGGGAALVVVTALGMAATARVEDGERAFLAENRREMDTMMAGSSAASRSPDASISVNPPWLLRRARTAMDRRIPRRFVLTPFLTLNITSLPPG
jgi:hypothetical protein